MVAPISGNEAGPAGRAGSRITKIECRLCTAAGLAAYTRTANVILANAVGAMAVIDGVAPAVGDRILLKDGAAGIDNGIYVVDALGGAGANWSMTRAFDCNATAKMTNGAQVRITAGTRHGFKQFALTVAGAFVLNTTAQVWSEAGNASDILVGTIAAMASTTTTISIPGAKSGDYAWAQLVSDDTGGTLGAFVGATVAGAIVTLTSENATTTGDAVVNVFVKRQI
jgi:hypothetical protein